MCRKKKSKSKSKEKAASPGEDRVKALERAIQEEETKAASPVGSGRNSPAISGSSSSDRKTAAEKRFEEVQKRRVCFHAL